MDVAMQHTQATMLAMQQQLEEQAQQQICTNSVKQSEQQRAADPVPLARVAPTQPLVICGKNSRMPEGEGKTWLEWLQIFLVYERPWTGRDEQCTW